MPVTVGLYLDGIDTLSIRDSFWNATFYVWFRWQGDGALNPGASFRLVDGRIERREVMEEHTVPDGSHYQRFHVTARTTKFFNTTRHQHLPALVRMTLFASGRRRDNANALGERPQS